MTLILSLPTEDLRLKMVIGPSFQRTFRACSQCFPKNVRTGDQYFHMACHRGFVLTVEAKQRLPTTRWRRASSFWLRRLALITVHPGKESLIDLPMVKIRWMDQTSHPPTPSTSIPRRRLPSFIIIIINIFYHRLSSCFLLVLLHCRIWRLV